MKSCPSINSVLRFPLARTLCSQGHVSVASLGLRFSSYHSHDAAFDPEELAEARKWHQSFRISSLPKGTTTYARSSGPGGQHVNKTESKAITSWAVAELSKAVPRLLVAGLRASRYYSQRNDSISVQAQTQRSRAANTGENHQKLFDELQRIYRDTVPGETRPETKQKYEALEKASNEQRIQVKKHKSAKKASRRGGGGDD
ncbi:hypothetical protein GQ53DRAFT_755209 [Thozetella sp. PMI_491]|nr:hypothetical protein GQ53DRAFT_755209 [Thozetella sp. PMI_491]